MKRFALCALSLFLVAAVIGMSGCDGGGIEPGVGDTSQPPAIPLDKMKEMANMADGKTPPPGAKKPPEKPAAAGAATDAPKN